MNTFEDQYDDKMKNCGNEEELEVCNDKAVQLVTEVLQSIDDPNIVGKLIKPFLSVMTDAHKVKMLSHISNILVKQEEEVSSMLIPIVNNVIAELSLRQQTVIFIFLGNFLNPTILEATRKLPVAKDLTLDDLKKCSKNDLYSQCDERLKSFINALTKKSGKTGRTAPKENEETEKHMFYKTNA